MPNFKRNEVVADYHHEYTSSDYPDFKAKVIMNARDAMALGSITALPKEKGAIEKLLLDFRSFFIKEYGGKTSLRIASDLHAGTKDLLTPGPFDANYADKATIEQAIAKIKNKPEVENHLQKFISGEIKLLTNDELLACPLKLSEFKIRYSSFVSEEKINRGLYSELAEQRKLENPYVKHYALEHNNELIACVMYTLDDDLVYDADFVIHPQFRMQKLAQAFTVKTIENLVSFYPNLTGAWFIAGGHGKEPEGIHLYGEVFPTVSLKDHPEKQKELGLFIHFAGPGPCLLKAANRDPFSQFSLDPKEYLDTAKKQLAVSVERDLAAKQPPSQIVIPGLNFMITRPVKIASTEAPVLTSPRVPRKLG